LIDDAALLTHTDWRSLIPRASQSVAIFDHPTQYAELPQEKARLVSRLKLGMGSLLGQDNLVYWGYGAHLIPPSISHVLSVCLIADHHHRLAQALRSEGIDEGQAEALIQAADLRAQRWVGYLHGREAWSSDLYDILIPMGKQDRTRAVKLILEHARSVLLMPTLDSHQAVADFQLSAQIEASLAEHGQPTRNLRLEVKQNRITIRKNGEALMTEKEEQDITRLASQVEGVDPSRLKVQAGRRHEGGLGPADSQMPSKVFLVDDEREYVETLSERLLMRQVSSVVVHSGEQALKLVEEDVPEVMVLDLRMPGMDGVEVLRRVKKDHPALEIIILTGHGSESDRDLCLELGAFAFLQKPVDMETLQQTMCQAYVKIKAGRR
jgi:CheY-like chemotaxis protein